MPDYDAMADDYTTNPPTLDEVKTVEQRMRGFGEAMAVANDKFRVQMAASFRQLDEKCREIREQGRLHDTDGE